MLKPALLPHINTQSLDLIAYLPVYLAVYNQVKNLTTGEFESVLGQKKSAAYRRVGVLQIVLPPSGEYTQDLRCVHRTRKFQNIVTRFLRLNLFKSNFVFTFIRGKANRFEIKRNIEGLLSFGMFEAIIRLSQDSKWFKARK